MKFFYPGFKTKALTFSYDDGTVEDSFLTRLFDKYGVKGTFNINTGIFEQIDDFNHGGVDVHMVRIRREWAKDLYKNYEVASHMSKHICITSEDKTEVEKQLKEDIENIENITGVRPVGFAYPGGPYDEDGIELLKKYGIIYARTIEETGNFELPDDFLIWNPTARDRDALPLAEKFADASFNEMKLLYIWGHSFEFQKHDINRYENMENILKTLSGKNDIWYAENREIAEYINAVRYYENHGVKQKNSPALYAENDRGEKITF